MANEYFVNSADLTSVAEAIREKGETTEQLVFPADFVTAIMAIESGGVSPQLIVTAPDGSTITAVNGEDTVTGMIGTEGTLTLDLPAFGEWTVTATLDGQEASTSIDIEQKYPTVLSYTTTFTINGVYNETVTISENGTTLSAVTLNSDGTGTVTLNNVGGKTLVFTGGTSGYEKSVNVGFSTSEDVNVYPDGTIYWHGRQFADITGGWGSSEYQVYGTNGNAAGTNACTVNSNTITFKGIAGKSTCLGGTLGTVEITEERTTLHIDLSHTGFTETTYIGVASGKGFTLTETFSGEAARYTITGDFSRKTITIDLSSVSGNYYIEFVGLGNGLTTVYGVYLT